MARVALGPVSGEAAPTVTMAPQDVTRISQKVQGELQTQYPTRVVAAGAALPPGGVKIKLMFTAYDKGNAVARAMLAGLGQMHIHAIVTLVDATSDTSVATFNVTKDFAWGGIYGAATSIEDLENGFAKSVAAIFVEKGP